MKIILLDKTWHWNLSSAFFQYLARIEENTLSSELLRIQVIDLDEEFTDNWLADFFFTSGNEGHWFEIETDPRTNEGILKVVKVRSDFLSVGKTFCIHQNCYFMLAETVINKPYSLTNNNITSLHKI